MKHLFTLFTSLFITLFSFAQTPIDLEYIATAGDPYELDVNLGPDTSPVDGPMLFLFEAPDWAVADVIPSIGTGTSFGDWFLHVEGTPSILDIGANHFIIASMSAWTGDINIIDTITVSVITDCICPTVAAPVCGVDGITYGNSCEAACVSVEVDYDGICEEMTTCLGDFEIVATDIIYGFAGPMLHMLIVNNGDDLTDITIATELGICPSSDEFEIDTWSTYQLIEVYFNFNCLSMAPIIEPYTAELLISDNEFCNESISFEFNPMYTEISIGCTDPVALNYDPSAVEDDGSCIYTPTDTCEYFGEFIALGESMIFSDEECFCTTLLPEWGFDAVILDCNPIITEGCTDAEGTFYAEGSSWNIDDCTFCSCEEGAIICMVVDCAMPDCEDPVYTDGECCPTCEVYGCTNYMALNYNPEATYDDDSCEFDEDCDYGELITIDVNNEFPSSFTGWNLSGTYYAFGAGTTQLCLWDQCYQFGMYSGNPEHWEATSILITDASGNELLNLENGHIGSASFGLNVDEECNELTYSTPGCIDPIALNYDPEANYNFGCEYDGCYLSGDGFIAFGETLTEDCESCFCNEPIILDNGMLSNPWVDCFEIADCGGDACDFIDCPFGCIDGECIEIDLNCYDDEGLTYPIGAILEGECETCTCMELDIMIFPPATDWNCEEIADCGESDVCGCTDTLAINYNPFATIDDGSCILEDNQYCVTSNGDMIEVGGSLIEGCTEYVCIENPIFQTEGAFCFDGEPYYILLLSSIPDCGESDIYGCTELCALNYYPEATIDDGSCIGYGIEGCMLAGEETAYDYTINYECETCVCVSIPLVDDGCIPADDTYATEAGMWQCEEIADCADCAEIDCAPGFYCLDGECLPIDPIEFGCTNEDQWHPFGASIEQECNTCTCTPGFNPEADGFWMCTMMPCEEECEDGEMAYELHMNFNGMDAGAFTVTIGDITQTITQPEDGLTAILNFCAEPTTCIEVYALSTTMGPSFTHSLYGNGVLVGENQPAYNCDEVPCECPLDIWAPVCGSDNITYSYSCFAECAGVEYTDGECEIIEDCICPMIYAPVCGSDGITYGNSCQAECENITEYYEGECFPTSFCDQLEVSAESNINELGENILSITVQNNSINNINYPVFIVESSNEYVTITPQFENAYWIGAGESITNTYLLSGGGDAAAWVEASYFVSQLGQNSACAYPIAFSYEPTSSATGCYADGVFYPMGSTLTNECETCYCPDVGDLTVMPMWECEEIEDCGEQIDYILIMYDAWGDGWNGGEMTISNTNGDLVGVYTMEDGDFEAVELDLVDGCYNIEVSGPAYASSEISWAITQNYYPAIYTGGAPFSGVFSLNADCGTDVEYGCEFEGELYAFGSSIEQGCNTCYCQAGFNPNANGIWSCTEMACGGCTDPDALNYDEWADWDDESCEYNDGLPNWEYTNTGTNHTLVLQEDMFTDFYGETLEPGDWVGAFFEVEGELICGGYIIWEGTTTVIPAQGDDMTTELQDGFATGENFQWLVWDQSQNSTLNINASYVSVDQSTFAANGISVITELIAAPLITEQNVQLTEGWNMFSTYITNEYMTVEDAFNSIVDYTVIVKNNVGMAYLPAYDFDGIEQMIPGQGYQAKMTEEQSISFLGDYLNPEDNPITLTEGWNMIAYLRTEPAAAIHVFEHIDDLVIVKDNLGMAYLPEYDFDGIGNMQAGQGYQVKVLSQQTLLYLSNNESYEE